MQLQMTMCLIAVASLALGCGGSSTPPPESAGSVDTAEEGTEPATPEATDEEAMAMSGVGDEAPAADFTVDCSRIGEADYRAEVEAHGIDPDSIDCEECDGCEE